MGDGARGYGRLIGLSMASAIALLGSPFPFLHTAGDAHRPRSAEGLPLQARTLKPQEIP
jgi:hypothetical protein